MKKASIILAVLFLGIFCKSFAQTVPPTDFFAGKWEINLTGTPNGDVKFLTTLTRKDGKLSGELANASDATQAKRPISKVDESADKIIIYFESSQGGEIALELAKIDNDNLKGILMDSFDASAKRLKD
ncbi:hypothetical protein [Dyadobacter sp. LHD-138]|uniref:hypothetical protein n=1 Tax=Dyadobacter sp. LHD-138 TaxID=3071413 RepID=UPI0027DF5172|nr:hypothetical protein [Dyadobacter sp. LHD-138]MDQ6481110.1 hypothetical protein [Dyadobacter sp. LHD-138]